MDELEQEALIAGNVLTVLEDIDYDWAISDGGLSHFLACAPDSERRIFLAAYDTYYGIVLAPIA